MPWSDPFHDPIPLPDGRELVTLEDAAAFIATLPKKHHALPHWQMAGGILIAAAEGRDFVMHARIAMLQALNFGQAAPDTPPRRKLAKSYRIVR